MEHMRLRIGMLVAFAAGYVLGARAGTERYRQIVDLTDRVRRSSPVAGATGLAAEKARAAATLGVERVRDLATTRPGRGTGSDATTAVELTVVSVTEIDEP